MAVHSHVYRPYEGVRTPIWIRPLVVSRYALADALARKMTIVVLIISVFPSLLAASVIYLHHNVEALKILDIPIDQLVRIDSNFFFQLLKFQVASWGPGDVFPGMFFVLTVVCGPRMLIADLRDNALPLYLSRPLSRFEYVLGKAMALATLGSLVSWIPTLLLVALQVSLSGWSWLRANWWIPGAVLVASWLAIALFTLVCLAVASVVRRKAAAEAAFFSFFIVIALVAKAIGELLRGDWWIYFSLPAVIEGLWNPLFRLQQSNGVSPLAAATVLVVVLAGAALVLERRVRAWEVVR